MTTKNNVLVAIGSLKSSFSDYDKIRAQGRKFDNAGRNYKSQYNRVRQLMVDLENVVKDLDKINWDE